MIAGNPGSPGLFIRSWAKCMARVPFLEFDGAPLEVRKIYGGQKAAAGKTLTTKFNGALQADVNAICPVDLPGSG